MDMRAERCSEAVLDDERAGDPIAVWREGWLVGPQPDGLAIDEEWAEADTPTSPSV